MKFFFAYLLVVLACFHTSENASAQTSERYFELGYQAYMRNQFPSAVDLFLKSYKANPAPEDRVFILKFLGISQYMLGDKVSAEKNFALAVSMDYDLTIYQEEILDPAVLKVFEKAKASVPKPESKPNNEQTTQKITKKDHKKKRKKKKRKKKSIDLSVFHFLPLGSPQFYNEDYIYGAFFGGAQIGSMIGYAILQSSVAEEQRKQTEYLNSDADQEDKDLYVNGSNVYIGQLKADMDTAMIILGLSYTASVIHGILYRPTLKKKKKKKRMAFTHANKESTPIRFGLYSANRGSLALSIGLNF